MGNFGGRKMESKRCRKCGTIFNGRTDCPKCGSKETDKIELPTPVWED